MFSRRRLLPVAALGWLLIVPSSAGNLPPLPVFDSVDIRARCEAQATGSRYLYTFTLTTGSANTVEIWDASLTLGESIRQVQDICEPESWTDILFEGRGSDPRGRLAPEPCIAWVKRQSGNNPLFVGTYGPFGFSVAVPPSLQEAYVNPWLDPYFDAYLEATGESELLLEESMPLEESYVRKIPTLAPLSASPGTFEHWNVFLSDVEKAGTLGWIADAGLLSGIREKLSAARQAALSGDLQTVNGKLDLVIAAAEASSETQMRREAKDLVVLNARYLKANLPWPCEPKLTLAPEAATHPVGDTAVVTARLVNTATGLPIANNALTVEVVEGPHGGTKREGTTDAEGKLSLSYVGTRLGEDRIVARTPFGTIAAGAEKGSKRAAKPSSGSRPRTGTAEDCTAWDLEQGPVTVTWDGGPNLVVPLFVPPVLMSGPGQTFYVTEKTRNAGNLPAGPTVTRYFLSTTKPVDPSSAIVVDQRSIPALAPGEESKVFEAPFTVPANLPPGTYYLDACADMEGAVIETKEDNNCASARVSLVVGVVPENRPPDCTRTAAAPGRLWPPNHKLQEISLQGVTDPDGDPVTVTVTAITQDEPTNGLGDGDTSPDGFGVGTTSPRLRAERSGTGNGRVYRIAFTASDAKGGSCHGSVPVGVPHDVKDTPVDDGQRYDSTK